MNRHRIFHSSTTVLISKGINQETSMLPKNSLMSHVSRGTGHWPKQCPGHDSHGVDSDRAQPLADICILCCSGSEVWSVLSSRARICLSLLHQGLKALCILMLRGVLCCYQMSSYHTHGALSLFCSTKKHSSWCKGVLTC